MGEGDGSWGALLGIGRVGGEMRERSGDYDPGDGGWVWIVWGSFMIGARVG